LSLLFCSINHRKPLVERGVVLMLFFRLIRRHPVAFDPGMRFEF
jgi:hypothetical protein